MPVNILKILISFIVIENNADCSFEQYHIKENEKARMYLIQSLIVAYSGQILLASSQTK